MAVQTVKAIINGQTYDLTYNSTTGKYEKTITAPTKSSYPLTGHYYGVEVKATDDAGNVTTANASHSTLGTSLRLTVKEKVAPVITITSPGASATITTNKPTITFKITDNDSGVNPSTIKLTIGSTVITGDKITKSSVTGGYNCTYVCETALSDGTNTVKVDASDYDGNVATQKSVTFKVDTVPPTLNVTAPANNLITNKSSCTVAGVTNDTTSSPVTVKIKLNNVDQGTITINTDGSFSKALTLANGNNTIVITSTDSAGKATTVTRTVELDTGAPVIQSVTLTPNPVDAGATFIISVEVTD